MSLDNNGIFDPVNHELQSNELNENKFDGFLDTLTDVPSSVPLRSFTIDKAGIVNQEVYVNVKSLFANEYVPIYCRVSMQVELTGHRGIHMSRCEEALFKLIQENHKSLDDFTTKLAQEIRKRQDSEVAYVKAEGQYLAKRQTVKTRKVSFDKIILTATSQARKNEVSTKIGAKAFNITGCPCTETYTKFSIVPQLKKEGFTLEQIKTILATTNSGTHTQRGIVSIDIDRGHISITYKALFYILDRSCHLIFELLKRPDEHELVLRALKKPQFTEDVVREVVNETLTTFNKIDPSTRLTVTSLLYDSIHIHDVYTKIDRTVGELKKEL